MAEVISLNRPNLDALALAEETVERIKNGQTIAVALAEVRKGGVVATAWSKSDSYHHLNSGCARLAQRICWQEDP